MTLVAYPDHVTDIGKIQNKVGHLHVPTGDIKLENGMVLKFDHRKEYPENGKGQSQVLEMAVWNTADKLRVIATVDSHPHGKLLHVSISYPKRDPSWGIIKAVRYAFFPADIDVAMMLPRQEDYINVHQHCFQMHQCPEKWGIQ
jgi:hypothetical protein